MGSSIMNPIPFLVKLGFGFGFLVTYVVGCYNSIINFGDSISDTGNLHYTCSSPHPNHVCCFLPYGQTFFHHPTARFSDGRLILDFIAMSLGLPLVRPSQSVVVGVDDFGKGINFAVGGATALDVSFFKERGIHSVLPYDISLRLQLQSFNKIYSSLCNTSPSSLCEDFLKKSLFIMGEIGGNDYNGFFFDKRNLEEVKSIVPLVIREISSAIMELIELGVETIMVPGNLPIGCLPTYLKFYEASNEDQYDPKNGCLKWLNQFSEYHNQQLQQQLKWIQALYPHVHLIYADYFNAAIGMFNAPQDFGFIDAHKVCCLDGNGSFGIPITCGLPSTIVCENPSEYISWDGVHFTEAAYKLIATNLLEGPFTIPPLSVSCFQQNSSTKLLQFQ